MAENTVIAVILAAGSGRRLKSSEIPKQFVEIGGTPMLALAAEKFALHPQISKVLVVVSEMWMGHAKELFKSALYRSKLDFCAGGDSRQHSLYLACQFIEKNFGSRVAVVSHDAARPFVSKRIIDDNINSVVREGYACDTVIPATDTLVQGDAEGFIRSIPDRNAMYQGQTPQSFICEAYLKAYGTLGEDPTVTDAAKLLVLSGEKVGLVQGEPFNIKVTTDFDLEFANYLVARESS